MKLMVKVCGISTPTAIEAALAAGVDAVGFVFHEPSPRHLSPEAAAGLVARVPAGVLKVAVTLHPAPSLVKSVLARFVPDAWQTDFEDFAALELPDDVQRWPVIRAGGGIPEPLPSRFLFEGPRSGRGEVADWSQAAALARRGGLILGGGLDAGNVAAAVSRVRPFGVDVSSGVESTPGCKDPARIMDFITAARAAAEGVAG